MTESLETKIEVLCTKIDSLVSLIKWQSMALTIVVCVLALGNRAAEVLDRIPLAKAVAETTK